MEGKSGGYYVFVVPIEKEVDRKAAAKSVGEKTVDMIHVKDLTKITGYIRGGCSPLGMKKNYTIYVNADDQESVDIIHTLPYHVISFNHSRYNYQKQYYNS